MPTLISRRKAVASILAALSSRTIAQSYPSRPITIVVPFAAGGATDVATRTVAERMSASLGQPVIVENKPGAAGTIGTDFVARAAHDGYTLGAIGASTGIHPHLMGPPTRYKFDDLAYLGQLAYVDVVLVARKGLEANNAKELIELARSRPGKLTCGDSGTALQLVTELFKVATHTDMVRVPYKGDAPAVADLAGGHVDLGMLTLAGTAGQIKAGTIKAIGIASRSRSKSFPEIPTLAEGGVSGFEAGVPTMLAVPKGTPRPVIERLNTALNQALADTALIERFASLGLSTQRYTPAEAQSSFKAEYDKVAQLIRDAHISTER